MCVFLLAAASLLVMVLVGGLLRLVALLACGFFVALKVFFVFVCVGVSLCEALLANSFMFSLV